LALLNNSTEILRCASFTSFISQPEINVNICKIIRERCNDVARQNIFSDVNVNVTSIFYCEMKHEWGKDSHIDKCIGKEKKT
jgi:hypothetical protein